MAKMSERQREYFLSRVNDEIYNHKRSLELKESSAKEKMVKTLYPKYVEQVGLKKELAELQTLETKYNKLLNHMGGTIGRMFEAEDNMYMHTDNNSYAHVVSNLTRLAKKTLDREFVKSPEGKAMLQLDQAHQRAKDIIWSAGSDSNIMQVVGNVLSKDAGISLDFNPLQIESKYVFERLGHLYCPSLLDRESTINTGNKACLLKKYIFMNFEETICCTLSLKDSVNCDVA